MVRCAISDGARFGAAWRQGLLDDAARWAAEGVEFVQLREKSLEAGALLALATAMMRIFREHGGRTRLLVNGRVDVAVAAGADGAHLTAHPEELTADQVRKLFAFAGLAKPVVGVSCHTLTEVQRARGADAGLILFGPVFEKRVDGEAVAPGTGLDMLRSACAVAEATPVLALGGLTAESTASCLEAGAAGIAGIRLFT